MNVLKELTDRQNGFKQNDNSCMYNLPLNKLKCYFNSSYDSSSDSVYVTKFNTNSSHQTFFALGTEDGKLIVTDCKNPPKKRISCLAHPNAIYDIAWAPTKPSNIITASGDHSAALWDVGTCNYTLINSFAAHTRSIKTVVYHPNNYSIFCTGGRDNMICVWDQRCQSKKPTTQINSCHSFSTIQSKTSRKPAESQYTSVNGIKYLDDNLLVSCGSGDGVIKLWDLRKYYNSKNVVQPFRQFLHPKSFKNGFTSIEVDKSKTKIYASCIDSHIYAYNVAVDKSFPMHSFYGHEVNNFFIKTSLSPDGRYIISGSSSDFAFIWDLYKPGLPILKLPNTNNYQYNCVDWSNQPDPLIVMSSYYVIEYSLWKIKPLFKDDNYACAIPINSPSYLKAHPLQNKFNNLIISRPTPSNLGRSPTLNLPNLVVDGVPKQHVCVSKKRRAENWLTNLSNKKIKIEEQTTPERKKAKPTLIRKNNFSLEKYFKTD